MVNGCERVALESADDEDGKPGTRWELSPKLGVDAYNYNVAVLESGTRLSENAYHYHENQAELFHVLDGQCRVETEDDSFDLGRDEVVRFDPGVVHLLHNPFDAPCRLVAVGDPPEGRYPVEQVASFEQLVADRYPDGELGEPSTEVS